MESKPKNRLPPNVIFLSLVSLFNDIASEMIYPIVPIFLTTVLHTPVDILGIIEGIAEGTASIMKFFSGWWSDRVSRRKPFVVAGYSFGAVSKILTAVAASWPFVLFARFIDRLGKGIRTTARDSILLQNTTPHNKGFIFGFHRAIDSLGAVIGPLLALVLLALLHENMRLTFVLAFIPAAIGVVILLFFVHEKRTPREKGQEKPLPRISWKDISPSLKLFFVISMVFAIGNSSDAFLILRSKQLGLTTTLTVLAYVLYNVVQTVFAVPGGVLADRIGARRVFAIGLAVFALVYFLFGVAGSPALVWLLFPVYGLYIAFTDGVSKAYIAEFITERESGTYFGLYLTGTAICQVLASFVAGILWSRFHPAVTFFYGAGMAVLALVILLWGQVARKI